MTTVAVAACAAAVAAGRGPEEGGGPARGRAPELGGARTVHVERSPAQDEAIARLRAEEGALRARAEASAGEQSSLLGEISRLDQDLAMAEAIERRANLEAEERQRLARAASERADALGMRLLSLKGRLALVLEAMYRAPPDEAWRRVLLPGSSGVAASASRLARRQADLARELAGASQAARLARADASRRADEASRLAREAAAHAGATASLRADRQRRLRAIASDRARARSLADELARARDELLHDVGRGTWTPAPARPAETERPPRDDLRGLEGRKGRLLPPLSGRLRLRSGFGNVVNPRHGTRTMHHGIVLAASEGDPVFAVAEARVVFADWYKGFGRCLVLDHGAGWLSVYAHARSLRVAAGDDVEAGQELAEAGDTGSLDGPQLYFQLTHDGRPLDPAAWLAGMP